MKRIDVEVFVVPAVALSLVVFLYFHFLKRTENQKRYHHFVLTVAVSAFLLNFLWEVGQGPWYEDFRYDWKHISFCALASVADMLMVFILLFGFGLIYQSVFWIRHLTTSRIVTLVLVGCIGAVLSEMWHTARGDWAYAESMPMLPWVNVGLSPVLQFALLPFITFALSKQTVKLKSS
uniref:Uncharacterized protein n=1 Tax=Roseihalotalea indica TaxID=2867963 RepID=A0AA49GS86_9BACT|nr:hypothetical protein K4G66_07695 [Tunicatimonas sp. TK19036]